MIEKFKTMEEVRAYFENIKLECFECGKRYRGLSQHLRKHDITPDEYRERYGIPAAHGLVGTETAKLHSERCKQPDHLEHLLSIRIRTKGLKLKRKFPPTDAQIKEYQKALQKTRNPISKAKQIETLKESISSGKYIPGTKNKGTWNGCGPKIGSKKKEETKKKMSNYAKNRTPEHQQKINEGIRRAKMKGKS